MRDINNNEPNIGLTATEVSNIWSAFLKNSMELRFFEYFFAATGDTEIKKVVERLLHNRQKSLTNLKEIFLKENLTVPLGFTDEDVRVSAPKVMADTFMLYFCHDITLMSMATYPSALSDSSRKDIRAFFQEGIEFSILIQNDIVDLMLAQGVYLKPPQIAIDSELDFVGTLKYLNGFFGGSRPVNAAEIANLTRIIHRAQFSKMIFVAFSKMAKAKEVKHHFSKGRDVIEKVLVSLQEVLAKENIPISASGDYEILNEEASPFSDKLMLFFVNICLGVFCFTMVCQAMTSSLRSDIILKLNGISDDMKMYYGQGLLLAINEKWLEQPPQAVDRKV